MLGPPAKRRSLPRILAWLLACLLAAGLVGTTPAAADTLRTRLLDLVNRVRENHGLRPLRLSEGVSGEAKAHTRSMIRRDQLFHTRHVKDILRPYDWRIYAENIGCAKTLRRLHRNLMRSPEHRANILRSGFRRIGLGVIATREGSACGAGVRVWATEIYWG